MFARLSVFVICAAPWVATTSTASDTAPAATMEPHAAARASSNANPVITHTYLAAKPRERERLARYVVANWFAMDALAVDAGLFASFRLLENAAEDGEWDLVVEVVYNDACGYPCVAERFERIRAAHVPVPVGGKGLTDLGRVLRTETLHQRD